MGTTVPWSTANAGKEYVEPWRKFEGVVAHHTVVVQDNNLKPRFLSAPPRQLHHISLRRKSVEHKNL